MPDQNTPADNALTTRERIALGVIVIAGIGIALVAIVALVAGLYIQDTETQRRFLVLTVFNTLVPLFGTWVGTVIAFYFAKENFSAATQSTRFFYDNRGRQFADAAGQPRPATLADLLAEPELQAMVTKIAIVARNSTLADAKAAMASVEGCQDVFVTSTGQRNEAVVGWITNVDIANHSRA
jgi:hypothetical protein